MSGRAGEVLLSIVSPVYGAEDVVDELVKRVCDEASKITGDFEVILVEDRGPDGSWERILANCKVEARVRGIRLSRNFGQHAAITAGLDCARGRHVIVMDCDLQDDPAYIPALYAKAQEGFDIVYTKKRSRAHSWSKNITAQVYNRMFNYLVENKIYHMDGTMGAYSILSRKVVLAFRTFNDHHRHYLLVLRWLGFNHATLEIEHRSRYAGKSSYDFRRLLQHALNGVTSQSDKLLRLFITLGFLVSMLSFLSMVVVIVLYFIHGFMSGWASTIVVMLMSTGMILTGIGILGVYLGKTFEQTKNRPKYLISDEVNTAEIPDE
jgi:glycosyltransferase involved in cell wall biosynthesis